MTELNKEQFQNALHDLGYGDFSSAKIWFLGIDDGNGIWEPEEILDIDPYATLSTSENAEDTQAISVISKMITGLINSRNPQKWEDYLKNHLFTEGSEAFLTYMFPIGRGTQDDWFSEYEKICGFSSNDYYHYVLKEHPGRLGYLQDQMQAGNCRLLVFFGVSDLTKAYWRAFIRFFNIDSSTFIGIGDSVRLYPKERIVMLPQLSNYTIKKPLLEKILLLINENGLNPFLENNKK